MDYPGRTTYEPTILQLIVLVFAVTVITYPLSFILMAVGIIKPARHGRNVVVRAFSRANEILREQLMPFFMAWIMGAVACTLLLIVWVLAAGLLVLARLMEPGGDIINTPFLVVMGLIHVVAQFLAYRFAISESSWLE